MSGRFPEKEQKNDLLVQAIFNEGGDSEWFINYL